jgi:ESF2/ABP1 family protein
MKPAKLRQLLSQHGELGRIYCTPEDKGARQQRKKKGGNSGAQYDGLGSRQARHSASSAPLA